MTGAVVSAARTQGLQLPRRFALSVHIGKQLIHPCFPDLDCICCRMEAASGGCQLDVTLVTELVANKKVRRLGTLLASSIVQCS